MFYVSIEFHIWHITNENVIYKWKWGMTAESPRKELMDLVVKLLIAFSVWNCFITFLVSWTDCTLLWPHQWQSNMVQSFLFAIINFLVRKFKEKDERYSNRVVLPYIIVQTKVMRCGCTMRLYLLRLGASPRKSSPARDPSYVGAKLIYSIPEK